MYMAHLNLPIDNTLIAQVDAARGKQPRVSWIRDAITDKLGTPAPTVVAFAAQPQPRPTASMAKTTDHRVTPKSFGDHPEGTCDDPACPRFACRKKS